MDTAVKWFLQALGARVDALETALRAIEDPEAGGNDAIRRMAGSLVAPAVEYHLDAIAESARVCMEAPDPTIAGCAQALVEVLRREAAAVERNASRILVIGGDPERMAAITRGLSASHRQCMHVASRAEATPLLHDRRLVFIILHLVLPDADGRTLIEHIREHPLSASTPLLLLLPPGHEDLVSDDLRMQTDGQMDADVSPDLIVEWVGERLRRGHENSREARRDPQTGLLNRAGFREAFMHLAHDCMEREEPMAFAMIAVDHGRQHQREHGAEAAQRMVQHVGAILSDCSRATDTLARLGPFAFAACYPGEDQFGSMRAVQKVMERVHGARFESATGPFMVTLSAGITVVARNGAYDRACMEAERHLFQAQSGGGDRVVTGEYRGHRLERVLVLVEDRVTAQVLNHLLGREGLDVRLTGDPVEGLAEVESNQRFRLILVAEDLRSGSGFDVVSRLRAMPQCNRVPIVMLLSSGDPERTIRALELGASDYVTMPLSPIAFVAHIRRLLARGKPRVRLGNRIRRILLVDEAREVLVAAASSLHQRGGFQAYLSLEAQDAHRRIEEVHPDIVLLPRDLAMAADQNLLNHIDQRDGLDRVAVIVSVNADAPEGIPEALSGRICGVIRKPFSPLAIGHQIEDILELTPIRERAPDAAAHLNAEIARLCARNSTPGAADTDSA